MSLLLASMNPSKIDLLGDLCSNLGFELCEIDRFYLVPERGTTHLGNAVQKAVFWSTNKKITAISTDGGISIPALSPTWNSVRTDRALGDSGEPISKPEHLLRQAEHLDGPNRAAVFVEAVAIAQNGVLLHAWEIKGLWGRLARTYEPGDRPDEAFWLTGLWESIESKRRLWQLSSEELEMAGDPWKGLRPLIRTYLSSLASVLK
jgi:inosine/xanthosine triphosphate pyrophosphatase family protein